MASEQRQMYCSNCGEPVVPGAQFCSRCGAELTVYTIQTIPPRRIPDPSDVVVQRPAVVQTIYPPLIKRVLAFAVDVGVVLMIQIVIMGIMLPLLDLPAETPPVEAWTDRHYMVYSALAIVQWLYFAIGQSSPRQATFGKILAGIVVATQDGKRIGFLRATVRYFAMLLSILSVVGILMMIIVSKRRGLHDIVAGTVVIEGRRP